MAEESTQEGAATDDGNLLENIKDQMTEYMSNPAMLIDVAQSLVLALLIYFIGGKHNEANHSGNGDWQTTTCSRSNRLLNVKTSHQQIRDNQCSSTDTD